jgi:catechol 2,3-dioxygenase-like lactoylglutathione lyase family enzyme
VTDVDRPEHIRFDGLHHVQLAIPAGAEDACRQFWQALGLVEIEKPPVLAARGGCWFRADRLEVHCGVDADFRPAGKAHPGILMGNLKALADRLAEAGIATEWDDSFPGYDRFYATDPVGNRLEFMQPQRPAGA